MADQPDLFGSEDFEQEVQKRLLDDIAAYDYQPKTTVIKSANSKWRVASALQKAIRRGQVDLALKMAHGLHGFDPAYVWRRLCTVVMEEVGVGDVDLCARYLWVATKKAWRNANGGDRKFLYMLVEQMCRADKDRNACDLPVWGMLDPLMEEHRKVAREIDPELLAEVIVDNAVPAENRALAAQALAYWDHTKIKKNDGFKIYLEALRSAGVDEKMIEIVRLGRQKQYEMMPFGLPFVQQLVQRSSLVGVELDDLTQLPMIGPYSSEAFDRHNGEGKRAIAYFFASCEAVHLTFHRLLGPDKAVCLNALGAVLFRVEGHQVDRRLVYDRSKEIDHSARIADLWYNGVRPELQDELLAVVADHLQELHESRVRIVSPKP